MPKKKTKIAFITGITGQDGSYLAEFLLEKGYRVYGLQRRISTFNTERIDHLYDKPPYLGKFDTFYGDLSDGSNLNRILEKIKPDEIYNLAAQSHVGVSFQMPEYTADVTGLGALRLLDAIRETGLKTKFYQASTSEMFGNVDKLPIIENTPFRPCSPYGCAKVFAYNITVNYRQAYGLFVCNGLMFNHESPRRGGTFATKKITQGLAKIKLGLQDKLLLGNIDSKRDWGYSPDFVRAMWLMLQQSKPDDYVIATGQTHSVREFIEEVCKCLDIDLVWRGKVLKEKGIDRKKNKVIIEISPRYFRPAELNVLVGDAGKARRVLGWKPKVKFKQLAKIMAEYDFEQEKLKNNL